MYHNITICLLFEILYLYVCHDLWEILMYYTKNVRRDNIIEIKRIMEIIRKTVSRIYLGLFEINIK